MMKVKAFISELENILHNYKTVYMWGVFGAPVKEKVIAEKTAQYPSFYTSKMQADLRKLIGQNYFAFDCVCLIKAILWGWAGDSNKTHGGAGYNINGVPDVSANGMMAKCLGVTTNFKGIVPGAAVGMDGHIGIYIGDGKVIECTPKWTGGVQLSYLSNIGATGSKSRSWTCWGLLPYIDYTADVVKVDPPKADPVEPISLYAAAAWKKAVAKGINDGKNPKGLVTEEQLMKFFDNLGLLD